MTIRFVSGHFDNSDGLEKQATAVAAQLHVEALAA
jgi:hypothetical protein